MSTDTTAFTRRSDLDALRAVAMLLGIVLHGALSFFPSFWVVADIRQAPAFGIVVSAIHGFRMPLFFVMSGFFSAMLLHRRGRGALVKHRFFRVLLPLLLGLVTIVPATNWISGIAMSSGIKKPGGGSLSAEPSTIWQAAYAGDVTALDRYLSGGTAVDGLDAKFGGTPLLWAALAGRADAITRLVQGGANVNAVDRDGSTGLHAAAFLGHEKAVATLVERGAKVNAMNKRGETPLDGASLDEGTTRYFASLLQIEFDDAGLGRRKAAVTDYLRQHGAVAGKPQSPADLLMQWPLFNHLWFLWFLWWLVLGYAAVSFVLAKLPPIRMPAWLVLSPARYLWLVPLTMLPQWFMGGGGESPTFGPDTSAGPLPIPHVLAYYAIFFGFGALYFGFDDPSGRLGKRWWLPLVIALLVIFPLGTAVSAGWLQAQGIAFGGLPQRVLSVALQAAYPWLLTFGLMGLFRRYCPVESPTMRYLSDSAYWLYLAHLPLVIAAQYAVRDWPVPALVKFLLIVSVVTVFLLWTYQHTVRYTWLGRFLNGSRVRPKRVVAPVVDALVRE
jgi:peptidoglycan/LPS O-acetylase OafA/YrhL